MQILFLGGASSVGASCVAIELADRWFVVDAGVRVDRRADPLPDLSQLQDKPVSAVFVTHAHADHIGALPLLHQAFPTVPIFASRATALLMEVMLADAVKIMTRRAVEEMELPLYPETLVSGMLSRVRSLPGGETFSVSELPGVTISASRAGHIAGALSLGFAAVDGSVVVSGDISMTPQRTVTAATTNALAHPDVLILESTYGARLHPNRQNEEQRLAQAVAEGLAEGGHVLIPCFGLGRGQEILLLLQAAQEQGQIPDFPIYVDGLVRRVCDTYMLMPEALAPRLKRQVRRGYQPFRGPNVTFVRDERERERILAGPPACIVSSSGMLTGGPSAWYAARLLADANASILITGYQDEESPGKKLLDVAEHKQDTLDIEGVTLPVHCRVAKYSLSAHADGGELASYAAALSPRRVALVHGDSDARAALCTLLTNTDVVLPVEGTTLEEQIRRHTSSTRRNAAVEMPAVVELPRGIGQGAPFDYDHVEQLWQAVRQTPDLRIVTARELALIWYGEATAEATETILDVLSYDYEQRYFIHQHALDEAFRVRGAQEEAPGDLLGDLPDSILLLAVSRESSKPVVCRAIEPGAAVRVQLPKGVSQERTRFPFSAILEHLGPAPKELEEMPYKTPTFLNDLVKAARRIRRNLSAQNLAQQCREDALYTLSELCTMVGVSPHSLEERLAVAKLLHRHAGLFTQERSVFDGEGLTLYGLAPDWQDALQDVQEYDRPDQTWIMSVIEQYLGEPDDLYRRSIDPDSGAVTLSFHFPAVAKERYVEAIAAAAEETGVPISIAPQAHQGELARLALECVPEGLIVTGSVSLYPDRSLAALRCSGQASPEEIAAAQARFCEETGWSLEFEINGTVYAAAEQQTPAQAENTIATTFIPQTVHEPRRAPLNQHDALVIAQRLLAPLPNYAKVGADSAAYCLMPRFHFPLVAQQQYADIFAQLEAETGWQVELQQTTNQQELSALARQLLPPGLSSVGAPSLLLDQNIVSVRVIGQADTETIQQAQAQFLAETGWQLELLLPEQKQQPRQRLPQQEAIDAVRAAFKDTSDFYRVGADANTGILWIHFHFPDAVKQRYTAQLAALATQTGWRVFVYPHVQQRELVAAATRLLPEGITITGTPSVYEHYRILSLTITGAFDGDAKLIMQAKFTEETGWRLEIH
jgi:Cft2 family RNA processing exonuclease